MLGKGRVIWRFDPLILTDMISLEYLLRKVENLRKMNYQLECPRKYIWLTFS